MKVVLNENGTITLAGTLWKETITPDLLPVRLGFYTKLRDREGGRYAQFYSETVAGLERVAAGLAKADQGSQGL